MSRHAPAALAVPGDIRTTTGGYIYDRKLLEGLRAQGRDVALLALPEGFPDPDAAAMAAALAALAGLPPDRPVIVDGLALGVLDTAGLARMRAPLVALVHHPLALESGLAPDRARFLRDRERANLALAAHVIVPSPHTARVLAAEYDVPAERIAIALPGIERRPRAAQPADPPLILSIGLLHPRKGHDVLIAALARIADLRWQAVVAGPDWDHAHAASLRGQTAAAGLAPRLRLPGLLPQAQLDRLWQQAALFALATRHEGYGMVFAEALAAGLPIVGTAVGAVPDTVPEGCGLLVPPDDPVAFAAALRRVLTEPALRAELSDAALRAAARLPGWCDTAAVAGEVLDRVAGRPASP